MNDETVSHKSTTLIKQNKIFLKINSYSIFLHYRCYDLPFVGFKGKY